MPNQALKSLVEDAPSKDATLKKAEQYWDEAKKQAKKQGLEEGSDSFYAYVMSIVKRRLGYKEESVMNTNKVLAENREYEVESVDPVTGMFLFTLTVGAVGSALYITVVLFVIRAILGKGGEKEAKKDIKRDLKKYKDDLKKIRQEYADKIKQEEDQSKKKKIAEDFQKEVEKSIMDIVKKLDKKHDAGLFKKASKNDIRKMVNKLLRKQADKHKKKIRKMSEKSSLEVLSSAEIAEIYTQDDSYVDFDNLLVTAKLENYYKKPEG